MSRQSILKWGNSLAFRLPAAIARQLNVAEGAEVIYRLDGGKLIIEPAAPELPPFTEEDLARAIRKGKPRVAGFGKARGKEAW
jgi:antitoxin component of MazEF toxin-antitoxin module